ncbi:MAG: hypothetical protein NTW49_08675 [Bacteroidia bacterium]|nr:hypothetical protein [Bacteroidia bacterium]
MTILAACSPKIADKILWQAKPVIIDGKASEYPDMRYYSTETKMFYTLSNDGTNLYLCFRINDESMQMKIMNAGMEVWIDTLAKSKEQIGILFPLADGEKMNMKELRPPVSNERIKPDRSFMEKSFLLKQNLMQMVGFKNIANDLIPIDDQSGINVKIDWDNENSMIYEAMIPFSAFYKESVSAIDTSKIFTLSININSIQMPETPQDGGQAGGRPPQDGGPVGQGGPGGAPPSGGGNLGGGRQLGNMPRMDNEQMKNMTSMFEKSTFIMHFKLAIQK